MKPKNKCPKCGAKEVWMDYTDCRNWACGSNDKPEFDQSELCRERFQVQRLKRKVERLTERAEAAEWAVKEMQKTVTILRNPNF
jgi:ribosomal protein S27AE